MRIITLFMFVALLGLGMYVAGVSITGQSASILEQEIVGCSLNTNIEFLVIDGKEQVCFDGNRLHFAVENTGTSEISGLSVVLDADYAVTMVLRKDIPPGKLAQQDLSFGSQAVQGNRVLTVYPLVGEDIHKTVCDNSAITVAIGDC